MPSYELDGYILDQRFLERTSSMTDFDKPANVVIIPGEPDTPANDKNIIGIYLIEH